MCLAYDQKSGFSPGGLRYTHCHRCVTWHVGDGSSRLRSVLRSRHGDDGSKTIRTMWVMIATGWSLQFYVALAYAIHRSLRVLVWFTRLEPGQNILQPHPQVAPRDRLAVGCSSDWSW